jgi:hypothetical protein
MYSLGTRLVILIHLVPIMFFLVIRQDTLIQLDLIIHLLVIGQVLIILPGSEMSL